MGAHGLSWMRMARDDLPERRAGGDGLHARLEQFGALGTRRSWPASPARSRFRRPPARCGGRRPAARGACETASRPAADVPSGFSFGLAYWFTPTMESRRRATALIFSAAVAATAFCGKPARSAASMPPRFSISWNSAQARPASSAVSASDEPGAARRIHDVVEIAFLLQDELRVARDAPAEIVGRPDNFVERADLHAVAAAQHAGQGLDGGAQDVVVGIIDAFCSIARCGRGGKAFARPRCRRAPRPPATRASARPAVWRSP